MNSRSTVRAPIAWLAILPLAILNGAFRQGILIPAFGEPCAHIASTVLLAALILAAARFLVPWIGPAGRADAWIVGAVWLFLTLAFEFLAGHFLFGRPWGTLLADYDVTRGRIWLLALLATLLSPVIVHRRWCERG